MKTCPDCGERVYNLGCTWCNEMAYIEEQETIDAQCDAERRSERQNRERQRVVQVSEDTPRG